MVVCVCVCVWCVWCVWCEHMWRLHMYGFVSSSFQVERRVVNQLAIAFEQQAIKPGTRVKLVVDAKNKRAIRIMSVGGHTCVHVARVGDSM